MMNNNQAYLAHHGILKQKWGVRNGPPYPLDNSDRSSAERRANPKSKYSSKDVESVSRAGQQAAQQVANAAGTVGRNHKRKGDDLSQMSDAELKEKVNRMNLEQQYHNLKGDQVNRGAEYVREGFELAGAALGFAASAAVVYTVLKGAAKTVAP